MSKKKKKKRTKEVDEHLVNMQSIIEMAAMMEETVPSSDFLYPSFRNLILIELVRFANSIGKKPNKLDKVDIADAIAKLMAYAKEDDILKEMLDKHRDENKDEGDNNKVTHSPTGYL